MGFWGGHSWLGISHATFGEIRLGRQFVPAHFVAVAGDPFGYDYTAAGGWGFSKAGNVFTYAANSIGYRTPELFGGLTSEVLIGLREGGLVPNPANNTERVLGANVVYNKGPVYVAAAYNEVNNRTQVKNEYWVVTASYDFGPVRPMASYSEGYPLSTSITHGYTLGAIVPIGVGRLKALYARLDPSGSDNNTDKFGLGYEHYFSKRTNLYVDLGTAKTDQRERTSGFDVGLKHLF